MVTSQIIIMVSRNHLASPFTSPSISFLISGQNTTRTAVMSVFVHTLKRVHLRDTCTVVRTWNGKVHRDIKRIHFLHYSPPRDRRTTGGITQKRFMIDSSWYRAHVFIDLQQLKVQARRPSISNFSHSLLGDPTWRTCCWSLPTTTKDRLWTTNHSSAKK